MSGEGQRREMDAGDISPESTSRSGAIASSLGTTASRGSAGPTVSIPDPSKSTLDSELASGRQQRKARKKRKVAIVERDEEAEKPRRWTRANFLYDEYEEDAAWHWSPPEPKIQALPDVSPAVSQAPTGKKMTKKGTKGKEKNGGGGGAAAAAVSAEAEKIKNLSIRKLQEEIRMEKLNAEGEALDDAEKASLRRVQLENSRNAIYDARKAFAEHLLSEREQERWSRYLSCDGLPDPGLLADLNTYLFLWSFEEKGEEKAAGPTTVTNKCREVIRLLASLDAIIDCGTIEAPDYIQECKEIRQRFRKKLQHWLDRSSYRLLRQIERDAIKEDSRNARYTVQIDEIICCIWALIRIPVSMKQAGERDRKNIQVLFREMDLTIKMPIDVDCYGMAVRALWVRYDHYSDEATSRAMPELPPVYRDDQDLLAYCEKEYEEKVRIREEQAEGRRLRLEEKKAELEKLMNPAAATPVALSKLEKRMKGGKKVASASRAKRPESELEVQRLPYLPTPEQVILAREEERRKEARRLLFTRCEKTEVNLRKYAILGGVCHIDLVHQPPQPKDTRRNIHLTTLQLPKELEFVAFSKPYEPPTPAPDSERTPEVIEAEMKALEAAMEALALVTLRLPERVLWFEPPLVAHWLPERRIWSTRDVHDIKYNEEKQIVTFRTGRLGIHGLAAYRFVNLPYQSWEMKPESGKRYGGEERGVILSVTGAIVQLEFLVRVLTVGGANAALRELLGRFVKVRELVERMRAAGCDVFPERDAYSYVKGLPVKHPATESHLQACLGLLSAAYGFAWSRWNVAVGPRRIVLRMRELHGCVAKEWGTSATVLVTPLRASVLRCTEVSPEFSEQPLERAENEFFADIYQLALGGAGIKTRLLIGAVSPKLACTVADLLRATNVLSVSA